MNPGGTAGGGGAVSSGPKGNQPVQKRSPVKFDKLERSSLVRILRYYGLNPNPTASTDILALSVTNAFEGKKLQSDVVNGANERDAHDQILSTFVEKCVRMTMDANVPVKKMQQTAGRPKISNTVVRELAKVGEQVAAKDPTKTENDDGCWILASVLEANSQNGSYLVQDEDDAVRPLKLSFRDVRKLEDSGAYLVKGDPVLAVFPETTSFYRAIIAKSPKLANNAPDVVVRFEDDDDDSGRSPLRRVPARFVIRRSDIEGM